MNNSDIPEYEYEFDLVSDYIDFSELEPPQINDHDETLDIDSSIVVEISPYIKGISDEFVLQGDDILYVQQISTEKIDGLEALFENVVKEVSLNGEPLSVVNNAVNIPIGNDQIAGLVRSSDGENSVAIDASGIMYVNNLNVNRLTQTAGERFTLSAGDSTN